MEIKGIPKKELIAIAVLYALALVFVLVLVSNSGGEISENMSCVLDSAERINVGEQPFDCSIYVCAKEDNSTSLKQFCQPAIQGS